MGNYDTGQEVKDIVTAMFNTQDAADVAIVTDHLSWEECLKKAADAMAADATTQAVFGAARRRAKVKAIYYVTDAALTAHDTNFASLIVQKLTAAGATAVTLGTAATTLTAGTGSWVAKTVISFTLSTVAGALVLEALAPLTFGITKGGSGVVVPAGQLIVVLEPAGANDSTS